MSVFMWDIGRRCNELTIKTCPVNAKIFISLLYFWKLLTKVNYSVTYNVIFTACKLKYLDLSFVCIEAKRCTCFQWGWWW